MATATQTTTLPEGVTLTGQLVGVDEAYSFTGDEIDPETGKNRIVNMRPAIKLLVGSHIEKVPFDPDRVTAKDLIGPAKKGDLVTLPVRASGPYDRETRRSAPVRFRVWMPSDRDNAVDTDGDL